MSFSTFDDLVTTVETFSHRNDLTLLIPTFISIAENEMFNNETENLKIRAMDTTVVESVTTKKFDLPDRYEEMESITMNDGINQQPLGFRTSSALIRRSGTGRPHYFTIVGNQIELDITPDKAYDIQMDYVATPLPLSPSNQTNIVIDTNPNIYLAGTLAALYIYVNDIELTQQYYQSFYNAIQGTNKKQELSGFGPNPTVEYNGWTP